MSTISSLYFCLQYLFFIIDFVNFGEGIYFSSYKLVQSLYSLINLAWKFFLCNHILFLISYFDTPLQQTWLNRHNAFFFFFIYFSLIPSISNKVARFNRLLLIFTYVSYCTGYGLRPIGPWPEHSQEPKLSPNLIVGPYRFGCMIDKPTSCHLWPVWECVCSEQPTTPVAWYCLGEYRC